MWDVVRGIMRTEIGELKTETYNALEAESINDHFLAYKNYNAAISTSNWEKDPTQAEVCILLYNLII